MVSNPRIPNGTGSFISQAATYNADNQTGKNGPSITPIIIPSDGVLSIAEKEVNQFEVYPNPASDLINIKVNEKLIGKELKVFNQRGQLVLKQTIKNENILSSSLFGNGIYYFNISDLKRKVLIFK